VVRRLVRQARFVELRRRFDAKGGPVAAKAILVELESSLGTSPPARANLGPLGPV